MAMASCHSMAVCGRPSCVLLAPHLVGPSSLQASSRSSFLVSAVGCEGPRRCCNPGFLRMRRRNADVFTVRAERPEGARESPDSVDISVFRFTLGIPGFDDASLPTLLGMLFGGLVVANHAFSLSSLTAAQLRSEGVGLVLAAVSISLPFVGRKINGTKLTQRKLEPGQKQVFYLADDLLDSQRQDLAWVSYNLLRNTSTTAMFVWNSSKIVVARGFWGAMMESGPTSSYPLGWLQQKLDVKLADFTNLKEPLYLSTNADAKGWEIFPKGTASVLIQPFPMESDLGTDGACHGFLVLISNTPSGYRRKDRFWTAYLAKKLSNSLS